MPGTAVIGLQWGDEAKGKIVDLLTGKHDIVVRYQGGANAGHTVVAGDKKYKLSLIPSGIFHPQVQCVVAGGVVLHPKSMLAEMDTLTGQGVSIKQNLMISDRAHVIFPWHFIEDALFNKVGNTEAIGTTMRGIGPCYRDKIGRTLAVRLGDLYQPYFPKQIAEIIEAKKRMFGGLASEIRPAAGGVHLNSGLNTDLNTEFNAKQIVEEYLEYAERLRPFAADTTDYLLNAVDEEKNILFEGAQGSLLDVDHGTFPYVTGSNSSAAGICGGSGVPLHFIKKIIGVVKAYTTRVGGGPCPTEQDNDTGVKIRTRGNEIGTITKRPRRCGWFDAVAVRYSARLGGVDSICLTLLDVLSTFDTIQVCVAYEIDGQQTRSFPGSSETLRRVKPVYETLPGWQDDLRSAKQFSDLPAAAQNYVRRIGELVGKPVEIVSVGPDREQTMVL